MTPSPPRARPTKALPKGQLVPNAEVDAYVLAKLEEPHTHLALTLCVTLHNFAEADHADRCIDRCTQRLRKAGRIRTRRIRGMAMWRRVPGRGAIAQAEGT